MVRRMSGVWTQQGTFAETEGLCDKRTEVMLPVGGCEGGGGLCGLCLDFKCTLSSLQLRKTKGYLSQCSQHVLGIVFCRFDCLVTCNVFWSAISTHFQLSYFGQASVGRNALPNLGFLDHVTLSL